VVCRSTQPKRELIRLALVQGVISEDRLQRLEGRGAYVCSDGDCVQRLRFDKRLRKAFRDRALGLVGLQRPE
jgi:predicted RNA-binding protein YlxR (DUF448 family)